VNGSEKRKIALEVKENADTLDISKYKTKI
jgi:hypothetical protein